MRLLSLSIRNFRNLEEVVFTPAEQATLVVGANGQGKTNLVEALYLLATLRPLRAQRFSELIRFGQSRAELTGRLLLHGIERTVGVGLGEAGREALVDGKPVRGTLDYLDGVSVVAFTPDDLAIVKGSPDARRRLIDRATFNRFPRHLDTVREYQRALKQRNRLLKEGAPEPLIEVYDEVLARAGGGVRFRRQALLSELMPRLRRSFGAIALGDGELAIALSADASEGTPREELEADLREALRRRLPRDRERGFTSVGPHADDLELAIDGRSARTYASQGQQRSIILAFKIAEIDNLREQLGEPPLLLLDDVSSELDPARNAALAGYLRDSGLQVVLTTTDARVVLPAAGPEARLYRAERGRIEPAPIPEEW